MDDVTAGRIGPVAQTKAFRNILVHAYDAIDHEIVWDVIQNQLPPLLNNLESLLHEADEADDG